LVSAFGDTPEEALQGLMVALGGVEESHRKAGEEMPALVLLAEAG
jgi:predicted RNase H-like HicB family nuclease